MTYVEDKDMSHLRAMLSADGLFGQVHEKFQEVRASKKLEEPKKERSTTIPLVDCLMSGLAVFSLKYPSLLQFEDDKRENEILQHNLKTLFHVNHAPSDTQMRERLDDVEPDEIRKAYKTIFAKLQRGKVLEPYQYLGGYLLSMDGTGYFSSSEVHCENCCEKRHNDGSKTYYHQMLAASIVHPHHKVVIPLAPEPIIKQDGQTKNDCERNAAKRFLENVKREHPHLKLIVVEDGLSSNMPHIETLKSLGFSYILGVKSGDHKFLFEWIEGEFCTNLEQVDTERTTHKFKFINNAPLNEANFDCKVNFIEYWEMKKNGKQQHFSWVTDIIITKDNVFEIMKGGRARWRIENETFNTLKNQGYQFEHNFGHGYRHLSTVFAMLMMLAFLIDQTQALCSSSFKRALTKKIRKIRLWEMLRNVFRLFFVKEWVMLFDFIADGPNAATARALLRDTS
jgi:hypothetical protein